MDISLLTKKVHYGFIDVKKHNANLHDYTFYNDYVDVNYNEPLYVYEVNIFIFRIKKPLITVYHKEGTNVYVVTTFWMKQYSNVSILVYSDFYNWYESFMESNEVKNYIKSLSPRQRKSYHGKQQELF